MKAKINITKNGEILKLPIKKLSLAIFYTRLFFLEKSIKRYAMGMHNTRNFLSKNYQNRLSFLTVNVCTKRILF